MNDLIVNVSIWGQDVGSLYWDGEMNAAIFEYERKFARSGLEISPIVMPLGKNRGEPYQFLSNRTECFKGLPGLFADSLPDKFGNQIINEWFASHGLPESEITPLDRLCYMGKRAMGAMEFEPCKKMDTLGESSVIHVRELTELAKSVFTDRKGFQSRLIQNDKDMLDILKVGTSAGGAKPKAIIAYNEKTGEVRSGQVQAPEGFGYWLLKFDGGTFSEHSMITDNPRGIGNIEYAYHLMAKDCGIDMTECRLFPEGESHHFMTRRFDRAGSGDKIHVQTLAGLAHLDRDQRHSYEEAFRITRTLGLGYPDQEELYRRMIFNVMARNHDDHTKNLSFLMDKSGKWSLAPAYDLCYSYTPNGRWTDKHQMSLNGKREGFTGNDLLEVGEKMGIRTPKHIMERVTDTIMDWPRYAKLSGVREEHKEAIADNLLTFRTHMITVSDSLDQEFQVCVETGNIKRLMAMKTQGYIPSPTIFGSLKRSVKEEYVIAAGNIFGLDLTKYNQEGIRLALGDRDTGKKNMSLDI